MSLIGSGQTTPSPSNYLIEHIKLLSNPSCFELCDILRLELTGYVDTLNLHIMKDGSGSMIGCVCR